VKPTKSLIAVAGMAVSLAVLPAVASAQTAGGDVAYCHALSKIYVRYIGWDFTYGEYARQRANNDAQVAVTKCQSDPAFAIPVLERELRAQNFTLPPRGRRRLRGNRPRCGLRRRLHAVAVPLPQHGRSSGQVHITGGGDPKGLRFVSTPATALSRLGELRGAR
jgi:hypothetical protein